ncbi:uncharacterized protein LOC117603364 isoform X1 [Osmia lignaria lignaria]|uniref:uncharacterized protein LOC117603364 isoform X1 n=2 Tax=Osmia lignaria lignaria TaxID=1437193 RepID=UPI001478822C|nr:uncharacterized protein LOC117603364 isoform X1 [Osmia lignaria]
MTSETSGETSSLEHLHREAFNCLETFPNKIIELNAFINEYMPESVKNNKYDENAVGRKPRCQSTLSTTKNCDLNSVSDFGVSSYYSMSMCDRSRSRHGICKRKYYRSRGVASCNGRRRPGPLGQLLAFIVSTLTACTKKIVIAPSKYLINNVVSTFFQRRELKNAECGPSPDWDSSLSTCMFALKKDTTVIGKLIDIMRPAVVKLITDTTILKRWLQAVALATPTTSTELTNATRNTETIDCWAYELFFHLKYLQVHRARRTTADKVLLEEESKPNELIHANLWHRLVQLRDNYIILYETLQTYDKTRNSEAEKQQE